MKIKEGEAMIEIKNVSKSFEDIKAVDDISITINDGSVFGLIGTNGAGKSTLLRIMSGIYLPDAGSVTIDGMSVFENPEVKEKFFYISDEQYFFKNSTPMDLMKFYSSFYKNYNQERFVEYLKEFNLSADKKISTFSKGMKKQLSVVLGICAMTKYLYCDETFDGLDPLMRQRVKSIFAGEMSDRDFTPIIASHNLRELEDICDYIGLLHEGGIVLSRNLEEVKEELHKFQCVFPENIDGEEILKNLELLTSEKRGSLYTFTAKGDDKELLYYLKKYNPIFVEALPLTLEEIFITNIKRYQCQK